MRRLKEWSIALGTLAFVALPMLAAGCAENEATSSDPVTSSGTNSAAEDDLGELGELGDLSEDLGAPMEAGSTLGGFPETGSSLGELPETGSSVGELPEADSNEQ